MRRRKFLRNTGALTTGAIGLAATSSPATADTPTYGSSDIWYESKDEFHLEQGWACRQSIRSNDRDKFDFMAINVAAASPSPMFTMEELVNQYGYEPEDLGAIETVGIEFDGRDDLDVMGPDPSNTLNQVQIGFPADPLELVEEDQYPQFEELEDLEKTDEVEEVLREEKDVSADRATNILSLASTAAGGLSALGLSSSAGPVGFYLSIGTLALGMVDGPPATDLDYDNPQYIFPLAPQGYPNIASIIYIEEIEMRGKGTIGDWFTTKSTNIDLWTQPSDVGTRPRMASGMDNKRHHLEDTYTIYY